MPLKIWDSIQSSLNSAHRYVAESKPLTTAHSYLTTASKPFAAAHDYVAKSKPVATANAYLASASKPFVAAHDYVAKSKPTATVNAYLRTVSKSFSAAWDSIVKSKPIVTGRTYLNSALNYLANSKPSALISQPFTSLQKYLSSAAKSSSSVAKSSGDRIKTEWGHLKGYLAHRDQKSEAEESERFPEVHPHDPRESATTLTVESKPVDTGAGVGLYESVTLDTEHRLEQARLKAMEQQKEQANKKIMEEAGRKAMEEAEEEVNATRTFLINNLPFSRSSQSSSGSEEEQETDVEIEIKAETGTQKQNMKKYADDFDNELPRSDSSNSDEDTNSPPVPLEWILPHYHQKLAQSQPQAEEHRPKVVVKSSLKG